MATSSNLQCSICLEDFKQPKFLDCFHTFCLECLRGLENKTPGFINCPLCQRKVKLPSGGVDKLTTNFYIQDTSLVGVEGGKIVPRMLSSYYSRRPITSSYSGNSRPSSYSGPLTDSGPLAYSGSRHRNESVQAATKSQQQIGRQSKNVKRDPNEHKLIQIDYSKGIPFSDEMDDSEVLYIQHGHKFCGIMFHLWLKGEPMTLTLGIELSKTNEFIHSCDIDYDITFINQKDAEFSTRARGKGYVQSSQGYPYQHQTVEINLIRVRDAINDKNGFIFNKSEDGYGYTFQLSVGMTVSNIKKVNFDL